MSGAGARPWPKCRGAGRLGGGRCHDGGVFSAIDRLLRRHPLVLAAVVAVAVVGFAVARVVGEAGGGQEAARCDEPVAWHEAGGVVGRSAAVVGPVAGVTHAPEVGGGPTFVNLGAAHPEEPRFDVVVYEGVAERFDEPLAALEGAAVCAVGEVRERDGVPQTVLDFPGQLRRVE